jgi:hypothetical protein
MSPTPELKAFHTVSHLVCHQAIYVPIATLDRHLAPHLAGPLRSIRSLPTRVRWMFLARHRTAFREARKVDCLTGSLIGGAHE